MSQQWDGHVKIHEGCGGVCRWVEAVLRPGVGYHGECLACGADELPVEQMIPMPKEMSVTEATATPDLESAEWDDDADFDENMHRLYEEYLLP